MAPDMEDISEGDPLTFAALVFMRRELAKVGEVRLSPMDFEVWQHASRDGVLLKYDETTRDIILTHVAGRNDA